MTQKPLTELNLGQSLDDLAKEPLTYTIHELGLIEFVADRALLVAVSEIGEAAGFAYALLLTEEEEVRLKTKNDSQISLPPILNFENKVNK